MKLIIENTDQIVCIENREGDCRCAVPGRIWQGKTDTGIYVQCVITRIGAPSSDDLSQFEQELRVCDAPKPAVEIFPMRMVI